VVAPATTASTTRVGRKILGRTISRSLSDVGSFRASAEIYWIIAYSAIFAIYKNDTGASVNAERPAQYLD
jgi:hypothetical protein